MLKLSQINIYPVKSLDGYSVQESVVEKKGLKYDRRWMIIDLEGKFMTQRTNGKMALLKSTIEDGSLVITEKENSSNKISIPINTYTSYKSKVIIWDDMVEAADTSDFANQWLSNFLNTKCKLVYMPDDSDRLVEEKYNRGKDVVSFADGYPFLIIGEESMKDLNKKIIENPSTIEDTNYSIRRFRANFIFSGGHPYQEDEFSDFKIGYVDFIGVKPCARCVLITRDPDTGMKAKEPLATLSTYRQVGHKVLFGQNVLWNFEKWTHDQSPTVKVGDQINF
jgi:uncharacterized protein